LAQAAAKERCTVPATSVIPRSCGLLLSAIRAAPPMRPSDETMSARVLDPPPSTAAKNFSDEFTSRA
jgi:hypothetical protein